MRRAGARAPRNSTVSVLPAWVSPVMARKCSRSRGLAPFPNGACPPSFLRDEPPPLSLRAERSNLISATLAREHGQVPLRHGEGHRAHCRGRRLGWWTGQLVGCNNGFDRDDHLFPDRILAGRGEG